MQYKITTLAANCQQGYERINNYLRGSHNRRGDLHNNLDKKEMRPQDKYNKEKTTTVLIRLFKSTDSDIIARLDQQTNKTGYIKALIRDDIERTQSAQE